jgi:hypothetical protein
MSTESAMSNDAESAPIGRELEIDTVSTALPVLPSTMPDT